MKNFIFKYSLTLILAVFSLIFCAISFADTQGVESTLVQKELKALEASSGVRIFIRNKYEST